MHQMEQISQGGTGREQDHDGHQHRRPPAQLMVKNVKNEDVEALATQVPTTVTFAAMHEFTQLSEQLPRVIQLTVRTRVTRHRHGGGQKSTQRA